MNIRELAKKLATENKMIQRIPGYYSIRGQRV